MIGLLIKFLIPIVFGYFIMKKVKSALSIGGGQAQNANRGPQNNGSGTASDPDVIEICPDCGHEVGKRHRCKS